MASLRKSNSNGRWSARVAAILGLTVAVAAACGRNSASVTSPSGAAPVSLDHSGPGGHKHFTLSFTPTSVNANQSVVLHVTLTTCGAATPGCSDGASTNTLGAAQIQLPAGFTATAVGNFGGTYSAPDWAGSVSGQVVTVGASGAAAGTHKLAAGQSETFDVTVSTPLVCDTFTLLAPKASNGTFDDSPTFGTDWNFYGGPLQITTTGCVVVECPAAPSIAAHYLHFVKGIHPGSSTYQNIVSQVADHMGPQTDFDSINACTHPGYENAVQAYVDSLLP